MLQTSKKLLVEGRQIDSLHICDIQHMSIQRKNVKKNLNQAVQLDMSELGPYYDEIFTTQCHCSG